MLRDFPTWDILLTPNRDLIFPVEKSMLRNMRAYVDGLPDKSNEMAAIDDIFSISYLHFPAIFERLDDPKKRLCNDVMNALVTLPMLAL
eukprot:2014410-Pyramimonas_sp.AAC.1